MCTAHVSQENDFQRSIWQLVTTYIIFAFSLSAAISTQKYRIVGHFTKKLTSRHYVFWIPAISFCQWKVKPLTKSPPQGREQHGVKILDLWPAIPPLLFIFRAGYLMDSKMKVTDFVLNLNYFVWLRKITLIPQNAGQYHNIEYIPLTVLQWNTILFSINPGKLWNKTGGAVIKCFVI